MNEDFRDLLAELVKAEARFLVVGAHALGGRLKDLGDLEALGEE
ncbi:MAG TPA: hypothetical protein VD793_04195 [Gemmatimonadales bacterium]|nr:hypothetical protein [Gemmatimonadales bacterium]